jgi:hypothetical protein
MICGLEALGLAWDIEVPSEKQKAQKLKKATTASNTAAPAAPPAAARVADLVVKVAPKSNGKKHDA